MLRIKLGVNLEVKLGADCMGNLRWANTEPSMHFRKTTTDPSAHFRKDNTDPSVHVRKANTEFLLPVLLQAPNFTSKFTPSFIRPSPKGRPLQECDGVCVLWS